MIKTETEKGILSKEQRAIKNTQEEKLRALFTPFKGKTTGLKTLTPTKAMLQAGWNHHHLFTITADDKVYIHKDQKDVQDGYVRVIYYNATFTPILSRNHFKK